MKGKCLSEKTYLNICAASELPGTKEKNQTIFGAFKILFQKINYTSKWF